MDAIEAMFAFFLPLRSTTARDEVLSLAPEQAGQGMEAV